MNVKNTDTHEHRSENTVNAGVQDSAADANTAAKRKRIRRFAFAGLALFFIAAIVGVILWFIFYGSTYQTTNNAYVRGNVIPINSQVAGTVIAINGDDGDYVHTGDVLVELDPTDTQVQLDNAKTDLANAVRKTRGLYNQAGGGEATAKAQLAMVKAQEDAVKVSKSAVDKARQDKERRRKLVNAGAISTEEYAHMENVYQQALSQHQAAISQLRASKERYETAKSNAKSSKVMVDNTTIMTHPHVQKAAALLKTAYLNNVRTKIIAPTDGYIAIRDVQIGQKINPGAKLMAVVPLDQVWVNANYKEIEMTNMRVGQHVKLTSRLYGMGVEYDGQIASLGVGTGNAFKAPASEDATSHWIKVVQRVPSRVIFTKPEQLREHPLRIGLSMIATTDLTEDGPILAETLNPRNLTRTDVFDEQLHDAEELINQIIEENSEPLTQDQAQSKEPRSKDQKGK